MVKQFFDFTAEERETDVDSRLSGIEETLEDVFAMVLGLALANTAARTSAQRRGGQL